MAAALYAEVYLICMMIVALLLYWSVNSHTNSTSERWLKFTLICFFANFTSNFFFTLFNGVRIWPDVLYPASFLFKTLYHLSLCLGVYTWCGYVEATRGNIIPDRKKALRRSLIPLAIPLVLVVSNCWNRMLFDIDENAKYNRGILFQVEMGLLLVYTLKYCILLLKQLKAETDPVRKGHFKLTASFPLCILAAWLLSFIGESVPVICVCITLELLCLYMGTTNQQISLDKLTQVNNRQNLYGYLNYKLKNHEDSLYLLMIDVDYFKQINDTYGHLEGDAALIRVADALKQACGEHKKRPYIARYGGDEFIVLLEGSQEEASALAESIRSALKKLNQGSPYALELTIGYTLWEPGMDCNGLIEAADQKLYQLKRAR